jgi:DNA-binding IclR family transcriptional regulator
MLSALVTHGYVVQDRENRRYRLTMRMFQVGSRVADSNGILRAARPYLDDLAQRTGETIHLVTRLDNEVLYLYKEDGGAGYVRMASYVGLHNPMYCTGVGKSILAYLPEEELQRVWSSSQIVAHTPRTIIRLEDMLEEAARIRRLGYALDMEEHEEGVRCIAAPILDTNRSPIAAISLSAPAMRLDDDRIRQLVPLVLETAEKIAKAY